MFMLGLGIGIVVGFSLCLLSFIVMALRESRKMMDVPTSCNSHTWNKD